MKKILASSVAVLLGFAAFSAAPKARAADFDPWFATSRAGGYIDLWPAKSLFYTEFGAELQFRVARSVYLDMSFSGAYAQNDFYKFKHAAYGNPTVGAHYAGVATPRLQFFVGGTLTVPLLHDPDNEVAGAALLASPIRGYYDIDRLAIGHMALRAMGGIEWWAARRFYFRAELRPVILIKTKDSLFAGGDDATFLAEHAVEGEYRLDNGLGFGARIQGVLIPQANDVYQLMLEPFMQLTPRNRGLYLRLGFPCALDEDLGFCADANKLAAVRFAIGGQW